MFLKLVFATLLQLFKVPWILFCEMFCTFYETFLLLKKKWPLKIFVYGIFKNSFIFFYYKYNLWTIQQIQTYYKTFH